HWPTSIMHWPRSVGGAGGIRRQSRRAVVECVVRVEIGEASGAVARNELLLGLDQALRSGRVSVTLRRRRGQAGGRAVEGGRANGPPIATSAAAGEECAGENHREGAQGTNGSETAAPHA